MTLTGTPVPQQLDYNIVEQSDIVNVPDLSVRAGPTTLYAMDIDNILTSGAAGYVKLFDDNGDGLVAAVAAGTARAKIILPVPAVTTVQSGPASDATQQKGRLLMVVPEGLPFVNGLSWLGAQLGDNASGSGPTVDLRVQAVTQEVA